MSNQTHGQAVISSPLCPDIPLLYLDNHLLVVRKPHGLLVQGDHTGDHTLIEIAQQFIKEKYHKPGNVFIGIVHRIDRPAAGVVILARTSKAAQRLSEQFRKNEVKKTYLAWVKGKVRARDSLVDWVSRNGPTSRVSDKNMGKIAKLQYHLVGYDRGYSLIEVQLETGRHHQIRVQMANRGHEIWGDFRYGSQRPFPNRSIALLCKRMRFTHPTRDIKMDIETAPDPFWPELPFQNQ